MNRRPLGKTGLSLSEIGYGAWGIGGVQWKGAEDEESLRSLHRAFDLGVNFVDTALAYGNGHSEKLVGQAVRQWPGEVYIATKIPPHNRVWPAQPGSIFQEIFPSQYVMQSTENSLRNLGVETIDLQQFHVWNGEWNTQDEWRCTFEDLRKSGKVRHIGVSLNAHQPDSGLALIETGKVDALQVIYNIFDPTPAERLFPLAIEKGIGILARVPLDEGGLTGTVTADTKFDPTDFRAHYFRGDRPRQVAERVQSLIADLSQVENLNNPTSNLPSIALRFCLSNPAVTSVIPGMRNPRHVESNVKAAEQGALSSETRKVLTKHAWPRDFYA